jgi:hypothetical protein
MNPNDRLKIQNSVYDSQVFRDYKRVADSEKTDYYFSYNLASIRGGDKIDQDSLFSHSVNALKIKQKESGLNDIKYDLHILLVGTSLQPLMLSVSAINAKNILLLYSLDGTEEKKDDLKDYIKRYKGIDADSESVKSSEPYTVFSCIKNTMGKEEWKNKKICIDITGGKKSMVGGGFLAASILGIDSYYIDFEKYDRGVPVICTEFLNKLDNPYEIYNINEESLIKSLWERQDFDAVVEVAGKAIEKLSEEKAKKYDLENERVRLIQIKTAAQCYNNWVRFNFADAAEKSLINKVESFDYFKKMHHDVLSSLCDCKNQRKDAYGVILLATDRWTRGKDAISLSEYDKAALCFTQAIESLCAFRLISLVIGEKVISSNKNNFNPDMEWIPIKSLVKFLLGYKDINSIKSIPKKEVEYPVSQTYKWSSHENMMNFDYPVIEDILKFRNEIAHFECYDKVNNDHIKVCCETFLSSVRGFIILFIKTYQNEEKLRDKTFEELQAPFNFAKYSDFESIYE